MPDYERNYCVPCNKSFNPPLPVFCSCGNTDLIPNPHKQDNVDFLDEEIITDDGSTLAKIEIDPSILEKLKEPFVDINGKAGTGKTTLIHQAAYDDPNYIELCSTTGIAAVNLGGRTINSVLKYFNTKSLEQNYREDKLQWALRKIRLKKRVLGIEEKSMLDARQLDIIMAAVDEINNDKTGRPLLGVHLIGDFLQLPPVNAEFAFKSKYWNRFENNTINLDKIWRQDNPDFIEAINLIRQGNGKAAVEKLQACGVKFTSEVDWNFDGTTLISLNDKVDYYNTKRLNLLKTPMIRTLSKTRGQPLNEWKKLIPDELRLKVGAYVMILSNDVPMFNYVNGDCGTVEEYDSKSDKFTIKLKRNDKIVKIGRIIRQNLSSSNPTHGHFSSGFSPRVDPKTGDWIIGEISFHPLRLAYASTIHKSQGLSLDAAQIDTSGGFFGTMGMAYVAISRAKTPENLILVGDPKHIANKIITNPEVRRWV